MKNKRTFLLHLLFVFYLAALTWIILFKMAVSFDTIDHGIRSLNLIPFKGAMITNGRINFSIVFLAQLFFKLLCLCLAFCFRDRIPSGILIKLF